MSYSLGDIVVKLKADNSDFEKGLNKAENDTHRFGGALGKIGGALKVAGVALAATGAAAAVLGVKSVKAYGEAEKAQKQLEHAVLNVSKATKEQLKQTEALADALEKKGVLDGDNIKMGLAQLSTFGLSNKAVQGLGGSLADLAVNQFGVNASGEQLSQTANMIAKALNGQFGVLEKSGIRFTDAQKHMIEYGSEMEKVKAINEGFAQNLKFTNETALGTQEGQLARLKVRWENVQEAIGQTLSKAILPFIVKAAEFIASIDWESVINNTVGALTRFYKRVIDLYQQIVGYLEPGVRSFMGVVSRMAEIFTQMVLPSLNAVWQTLQTRLLPQLKAIWNTIEPGFTTALKIAAVILGAVIVGALWVFINVLNVALSVLGFVVRGVNNVINWFGNLVGATWNMANAIGGVFSRLPGTIGGALGKIPGIIAGALGSALSGIWNYYGRFVDAGWGLITAFANGIRDAFGRALSAVKDGLGKVRNMLPFSDAKEGPLSDITLSGRRFSETFAKGIIQGSDLIQQAVNASLAMPGGMIADFAGMGGLAGQAASITNSTTISGPINIGSRQDADYLLSRINRNSSLEDMGVAP